MKSWGSHLGLLLLLLPCLLYGGSEIRRRKDRLRPESEEDYNIRFREIYLDLGYRLKVVADDNTNRATDTATQESGIYTENGLDVRLYWPLTPDFTLRADIYAGYISFFSGEGTDGWVFEATSDESFAVDMKLGENGLLSVVDRISANVESYEISAVGDTKDLKMLENDLAVQYEVDLSTLYFAVCRLGQADSRSLNDDFEHRDKRTEYAAVLLGWRINRDLTTGLYGSYREHRYDRPINNDADEYEVGIQSTYQLTKFTTLQLSAGYQNLDFDPAHTPAATEDGDGITGEVAIRSQLTGQVNHSVSAKYHRRLGTSGLINFSEDWLSMYSLNWRTNRNWQVKLNCTWLHSEQQSEASGEDYDLLTPGIQIGYEFAPGSSLTIAYEYNEKHSDMDFHDYSRNICSLSLVYNF